MKRVSIVIFVILFAFASCLGEASLRQTLLNKVQPATHLQDQRVVVDISCSYASYSSFPCTLSAGRNRLSCEDSYRGSRFIKTWEKIGNDWINNGQKCSVSFK